MKAVCAIVAVVVGFASTAECKTSAGSGTSQATATGAHYAGYGLPRLPSVPKLPSVPRLPRVPKQKWP